MRLTRLAPEHGGRANPLAACHRLALLAALLTGCSGANGGQVGIAASKQARERTGATGLEGAETASAAPAARTGDPAFGTQITPQVAPGMDIPTAADDPAPVGANPTQKPGPDAGPGIGDDCSERVVSSVEPCSDDPDPCGLRSGWEGDEYCLRPPPPGEGVQIHFGPKRYDDPAETNQYLIASGQEVNDSVLAHVPLDSDRYFNRVTVHIRPGTHHWISSSVTGRPREGFYFETTNCNGGDTPPPPAVGGGQNLIYDNPPGGKAAPENEGIGSLIRGNSSICLNVHSYNFSAQEHLREVWVNVYFADPATVTQPTSGIALIAARGLNLPPGQSQVLTYRATFPGNGRIIQLFGHRHVWTPRFATWLNDQLVYDSHDWQASVTFNYDSLTVNPPIDPAGATDGAVSGMLPFMAGDVLTFSCFVENGSDHVLRFANELEGGEMCNLWGTTVGSGIPLMMFQ